MAIPKPSWRLGRTRRSCDARAAATPSSGSAPVTRMRSRAGDRAMAARTCGGVREVAIGGADQGERGARARRRTWRGPARGRLFAGSTSRGRGGVPHRQQRETVGHVVRRGDRSRGARRGSARDRRRRRPPRGGWSRWSTITRDAASSRRRSTRGERAPRARIARWRRGDARARRGGRAGARGGSATPGRCAGGRARRRRRGPRAARARGEARRGRSRAPWRPRPPPRGSRRCTDAPRCAQAVDHDPIVEVAAGRLIERAVDEERDRRQHASEARHGRRQRDRRADGGPVARPRGRRLVEGDRQHHPRDEGETRPELAVNVLRDVLRRRAAVGERGCSSRFW